VFGMSLEQIRKVPRSVAVAGGQHKLPALRGCLRGGLVNVLVTDCFTAQAILTSNE
jgi:deoxyribonucleoside regulator